MVDELATTISTAKDRPEYVAGVGGSMSGAPTGPKLGVMPKYDDAETKGMEIGGVIPGGAAEKAGLLKGDRITAIADKPVKNVQDYMKVMAGMKRGEELELTIERDGKVLKVKAAPK
jgi:S1-C subfamily serine protease